MIRRRDETRRDETRRDETRRDETRRDETRRDEKDGYTCAGRFKIDLIPAKKKSQSTIKGTNNLSASLPPLMFGASTP